MLVIIIDINYDVIQGREEKGEDTYVTVSFVSVAKIRYSTSWKRCRILSTDKLYFLYGKEVICYM